MEFLPILIVFLFIILIVGVNVEQEYTRGIVFRLGKFSSVKGPGIYWIIPFIDKRIRVDIRTNTVDVESQETVTGDSVTIKINAVLFYKVIHPEKAIIDVADFRSAIYQSALTAMRNVIGQHVLDQVLKDRDKINTAIKTIVDKITEQWGLRIERVEMKDVEIPLAMQRAMAKEAEAMREKRARIIKAEGEKEASVKLSEAAKIIEEHPSSLELRRMQMISEVGAEQNTTTIIMMPSDFITLARNLSDSLKKNN